MGQQCVESLTVLFVVSFLFTSSTGQGSAQACLSGFPNPEGPSQHSPTLQRQLVIPSYAFSCNTTVTRWEVALHTHGRTQRVARVDFQVWRQDNHHKYYLVGNNSYSSDFSRGHQWVTIQGGRLVMTIEDPVHLISVSPGDIVGVFFRGEGIDFEFRSSRVARTYQASLSEPLRERFSLDLAHDTVFRKAVKGSPLIRAQTDDDAVVVTRSSSTLAISHTISVAVQSVATSTDHDMGELQTGPTTEGVVKDAGNPHQKYLIGGAAGGGVLVFVIASVILGIVIRKKKQGQATRECSNQTSPDIAQLSLNSESKLLSDLQLSARGRRNLAAFKRRATAVPAKKDNGRTRISAGAQDIRMKDNPCYSELSRSPQSGAAEAANAHEYDVPVANTGIQPCEYEMPIESSVRLQNVYETVTDELYEEIEL